MIKIKSVWKPILGKYVQSIPFLTWFTNTNKCSVTPLFKCILPGTLVTSSGSSAKASSSLWTRVVWSGCGGGSVGATGSSSSGCNIGGATSFSSPPVMGQRSDVQIPRRQELKFSPRDTKHMQEINRIHYYSTRNEKRYSIKPIT